LNFCSKSDIFIWKGGDDLEKLSTSDRLKEIMESRNLRQVDILDMAKPYCQKYNVKMNKSDLSQYVSGLVEPGQDKLAILGKALGVNEVWLMGYDVPMYENLEAESISENNNQLKLSDTEKNLLYKYRFLDEKGKHAIETILQMEFNRCNEFYTKENKEVYLVAAHNDKLKDLEEQKKVRRDLDKL
jgi:transcriptional regulator with XRE-family HTH domain